MLISVTLARCRWTQTCKRGQIAFSSECIALPCEAVWAAVQKRWMTSHVGGTITNTTHNLSVIVQWTIKIFLLALFLTFMCCLFCHYLSCLCTSIIHHHILPSYISTRRQINHTETYMSSYKKKHPKSRIYLLMVAQWVALLPHSLRVPDLILDLGYCLHCKKSHLRTWI